MTGTTFLNGYALLVGVGGKDIPVTVQDATALRAIFVDPARAAYPPDQVKLLTETTATRQHILDAFDELSAQIKGNPQATVIVYFSGHGVQIKQKDQTTKYFLVPHNYDPTRKADTAISGPEFTARIEALNAHKLIVLLDCCFAAGIPVAKAPEDIEVKSVPLPPDLLKILETGSGRVVVASSREDEYSYIGTPYSVFTACLIDALAGKASVRKDGFARILDTLIYLLDQVPQKAAQHPFVNEIRALNDNFPLCYYAGGSKTVPGETPDPVPPLPTSSLTPLQRDRLEERKEDLLEYRSIVMARLKVVRRDWILTTNPAVKVERAAQLEEDQKTIIDFDQELDAIEQKLR